MDKYKYAGKRMKIVKGVGKLLTGEIAAGEIFEVEDYWINIPGNTSWMMSNGNPACLEYAIRTATQELEIPIDDNVVYGKIGLFGHLFHESELEIIE